MLSRYFLILILLGLKGFSWTVEAAHRDPAWGREGMVVTAHPLATRAGADVLKKGGNSVDAAVTAAFCLGVVEGYSSGIGGGSFILHRRGSDGSMTVIDARERAPAAARPGLYLRNGKAVKELSLVGPLAAGVPGTVAGLCELLRECGTISLAEALAPAIELAGDGFPISRRYCDIISESRKLLERFPPTRAIYLAGGRPPSPGSRFTQPALAQILRSIARKGSEIFYRGDIARRISEYVTAEGGIITLADLESYRTRRPAPITGRYRGYEIISMPPPSSGGIALVEALNVLEGFELRSYDHNSAAYAQIVAESMKAAYADRAAYLADDAFFNVPGRGLTSKEYAASLRERIVPGRVTGISGPGDPRAYETGSHTTHLTVVDSDFNAVSITQTVNGHFGSGMTVPGTGILLNNEMADFALSGGSEVEAGDPGGEPNRVEAGKTPLSSMTPTIITRSDSLFLVVGSPGGTRIITTVLQIVLNVIDFDMDVQSAVSAPRFHHQWRPDTLYVESDFSADTVEKLRSMGYHIGRRGSWSNAQAVMIDYGSGLFLGGSDPRGIGLAASPDGMRY